MFYNSGKFFNSIRSISEKPPYDNNPYSLFEQLGEKPNAVKKQESWQIQHFMRFCMKFLEIALLRNWQWILLKITRPQDFQSFFIGK